MIYLFDFNEVYQTKFAKNLSFFFFFNLERIIVHMLKILWSIVV